MSTSTQSANPEEATSPVISNGTGRSQRVIAWSSFLFALLQSICTFFVAMSGLRLAIGLGSLAISATLGLTLEKLHGDWIRLPMIALALAGSLLNLVVLAQVRRLRNRPAAQWRQRPLTAQKVRMERMQILLSIATLALIVVEEWLHLRIHHHL